MFCKGNMRKELEWTHWDEVVRMDDPVNTQLQNFSSTIIDYNYEHHIPKRKIEPGRKSKKYITPLDKNAISKI